MSLVHIAVLALVQGITEFLPVSSSAHLLLVPKVTGWPDQGLVVDVGVHVGTLGAVALYFRRDVGDILHGLGRLLRARAGGEADLVLKIAAGSLPVIVAGYILQQNGAVHLLRNVELIAWATIGFGVLLFLADRWGQSALRMDHLTYGHALLIGLSQALALIPGTSRSGITMTAARFLGFDRVDAARFSLLLSMPVIFAAGVLQGFELCQTGNARVTADVLVAAGLAFLAALAAISLMMAMLRRVSFTPFVLYRLILGGLLLLWVYAGDGSPMPLMGG